MQARKTIFFNSKWPMKILALALVFTLFSGIDAAAKTQKTKHHKRVVRQYPARVDREALYADLVIEARTGRILHASSANKLRHPASLTKMMTLYLAFQALEAGKLQRDQRLPISAAAAAQSPSKLGLKAGNSIRAEDAILGVVTKSANDAAVVLAEALGGSEAQFAQLMTRQARMLGMKKTVFHNASGLPNPDQVTTAHDMATLGYALIYHYPSYYAYFGRESFAFGGAVHRNHNHLMERYDGMDGIKTGYVRASGFNLVASAVRDNTRIIGVVFGGRSATARDNQMARLLDDCFADTARGGRIYQARAGGEQQGDAGDDPDDDYIALPSKMAAVFPSPGRRALAEGTVARPGNWGIQIGAYNDIETGQQALIFMGQNLKNLVGEADKILQKTTAQDGSLFYKARFMGMEERTARSVCTYMIRRGQSCFVVAPEQTAR